MFSSIQFNFYSHFYKIFTLYICVDLIKGTSRNFWQQSHLRLVQYLTILIFFNDLFSTKIPLQAA